MFKQEILITSSAQMKLTSKVNSRTAEVYFDYINTISFGELSI